MRTVRVASYDIPVRPITLLVGESMSGKSLALKSIAHETLRRGKMVHGYRPMKSGVSSENLFFARKHIDELAQFGKQSDLFQNAWLENDAPGAADVKILDSNDNEHNLGCQDAGSLDYPILLFGETTVTTRGSDFVLNQPEVGLDARGQAAIGTLLVKQAAEREHTFFVETHSDSLIDRVRIEVMSGRWLKPESVTILYFERKSNVSVVYPITIDENGNLDNAPSTYRSFCMAEYRRLLQIDD